MILSLFIDLLLKAIDRLTDLDGSQFRSRGFLDWLYGSIPGLSRGSPCQIGLMFFSLGVREVAALIGVQCEAESALVGADVIAHEIGILGDVDGLKGQFSQSLLPLNVCVLVTGHSHVTDPCARTVLSVDHYIRVYKLK